MNRRFESPEWHTAVAALVAASDDQGIADALGKVIGAVVNHDATCLLAFHRDAPPDVLTTR